MILTRLGRRSRRCAGAAIAVAGASVSWIFGASRGGADEPATARLAWVRLPGAEQCVTGPALEGDVSRRLGRDVFGGTPSRWIDGVVGRESQPSQPPRRWVARLYVRDRLGTLLGDRELSSDSPDCDSLSAAVGLAVALAIDPDAALALAPPPPSASAPPRRVGRAPVGPPRTAPSVAPAPSPREPHGASVAVGGGVAAGVVPRTAPVVTLSFAEVGDGVGGALLRFDAGALVVPTTRVGDGGVGFGVTAGWVGGCHDFARDAALTVSACAAVLAGAVHAVVYDLEPTKPGDRAWVAASGGARVGVRVGVLVLDGRVHAVAPIARYRFTIAGAPDAGFQQAAVGLLGYVSAGIGFF